MFVTFQDATDGTPFSTEVRVEGVRMSRGRIEAVPSGTLIAVYDHSLGLWTAEERAWRSVSVHEYSALEKPLMVIEVTR